MNIYKKENRNQAIASLEFFYFLDESSRYLSSTYGKSTNPLILNFLNIMEGVCSWEYKKIYRYSRALTDEVFWRSSKFYRETMEKFVDGELNALEFAQEFSDRLLADREEANNLAEDFRRQANIELNPKIFEFSTIILDFELLLEVYQNEVEDLEIGELSKNDLSFSDNSILEGVKRALEKTDKYFTD